MNQIATRAVVSRYRNHLEFMLGAQPHQKGILGVMVKWRLLKGSVIHHIFLLNNTPFNPVKRINLNQQK